MNSDYEYRAAAVLSSGRLIVGVGLIGLLWASAQLFWPSMSEPARLALRGLASMLAVLCCLLLRPRLRKAPTSPRARQRPAVLALLALALVGVGLAASRPADDMIGRAFLASGVCAALFAVYVESRVAETLAFAVGCTALGILWSMNVMRWPAVLCFASAICVGLGAALAVKERGLRPSD